jgi:hypothetical protein
MRFYLVAAASVAKNIREKVSLLSYKATILIRFLHATIPNSPFRFDPLINLWIVNRSLLIFLTNDTVSHILNKS